MARAVTQVALVMLGFMVFSGLGLRYWMALAGDSEFARLATLVLVGLAYAAMYRYTARANARGPAAWSSVALVVLELGLLSLMLPLLAHQATLLLPHEVLQRLMEAESLSLQVLAFIAIFAFALRGWVRHNAKARQAAVADATAAIYRRMAMEDGLTGLANRRQFEEQIAQWLSQAPTAAQPMSLLMIDVDHFKSINDTHSHNCGDEVLRRIGGILKANAQPQDLPARLAGDEFVVVLRGADANRAQSAAERLDRAVRESDWSTVAPALAVSISVGHATARPGDSLADLLSRSDQQMYERKRSQRHANPATATA